jgi:hypothetical protein
MNNTVNAVYRVICELCLYPTYLIAVIYNGSANFEAENNNRSEYNVPCGGGSLKKNASKNIIKILRF